MLTHPEQQLSLSPTELLTGSARVYFGLWLQDTIGFNKAALGHMRKQMEIKNDVKFFTDATQLYRDKKKRKRKKIETQRAVLVV